MKQMKRMLCLLLLLAMLTGCAGNGKNTANTDGVVDNGAVDTGSEEVQTPPEAVPIPEPEPEPEPEPVVSTLAICGDVMSHLPLTNDTWNGERYDFHRVMAAAEPYVSAADCAVANFETTMAGGPNYSGYPCFNAPDTLAEDLKTMGFDLVMTSNNHSMDKGGKGVIRTLNMLDKNGLKHVGTSRTIAEYENNAVVMDVGGISVAFLGYTYGTNGIPLPKNAPYAANLFNVDYMTTLSTPDEEKLISDLKKAEELGADMIAVMIHWGVEYQTKPNAYQQRLADLLIQNGADIILGGHSHVLQSMEMRSVAMPDGTTAERFVSYSLGNFISSQNQRLTDVTAVLTVEMTKDPKTGETTVTDYYYQPMLMLDREGGQGRFELLDVYAEIAKGDQANASQSKLQQTLEDAHAILGAEYDVVWRAENASGAYTEDAAAETGADGSGAAA